MVNDRINDQDEAGNNSSQKAPASGENRPGQGKQAQGDPTRGKQFEGGREGSVNPSERGTRTEKQSDGDESDTDDKE